MSGELVIKPAARQNVIPLCGFYGKSGSGKTMSALLFARGLVGPKGRITLIDTESRRGSLFADIIPGGYSVLDLEPPFSPMRYQEAHDIAEQSSDAVVYDSMSHEHAGEGGVIDMQEEELTRMAGENYQKREACKMSAWIKPKLAHKKFVQRLLRSKVPVICCLRGEEKTHMLKENGKSKVITDEFSTPIFDARFIFEMLVNFETVAHNGVGGFVIPRKITHPAIAPLLPSQNEQIGIKHGEAMAEWARGATASRPQDDVGLAAVKKELWALTKPVHKEDPKALEEFLIAESFMDESETLATLTIQQIRGIIAKMKGAQ